MCDFYAGLLKIQLQGAIAILYHEVRYIYPLIAVIRFILRGKEKKNM